MLKLSEVFYKDGEESILGQYQIAADKLKTEFTAKRDAELGKSLPIVIEKRLGEDKITVTITGLTRFIIVTDSDGNPCLEITHTGFAANVDGTDQIACSAPSDKYFSIKHELLSFLIFLKEEFNSLQYSSFNKSNSINALAIEMQKELDILTAEIANSRNVNKELVCQKEIN